MSIAIINRNIKTIARGTTAMNARIQQTALLCIEQAIEANNADAARRLVIAVAPRFKQPLVKYFETFSRINIAKKGDSFVCSISKAESRVNDIYNAERTPWFETPAATKDDLPTTLEDLDDGVINLVKRMEKRLKDGKVLEADKPAFVEKLDAIKALAA